MNAEVIIPVKYRRNIVKLDRLTTHGRRIFLRSTRENALYFVVFLAFLQFFFFTSIDFHVIWFQRYDGLMPQIDNYCNHCSPLSHTISLRAWSTKIFLVKCFRWVEWICVHLFKVSPINMFDTNHENAGKLCNCVFSRRLQLITGSMVTRITSLRLRYTHAVALHTAQLPTYQFIYTIFNFVLFFFSLP